VYNGASFSDLTLNASPLPILLVCRLFVLLGPQNAASSTIGGTVAIPNVLCVLQVAFEGFISQKSIQSEMSRSSKASGAYSHHAHICFECS
jgi:hypothetical protein